MDNITSLAEYGATGIAIAILIVIALIMRWLIPVIKEMLEKLIESIDKNTEYLKLKNGALEKLIVKTEQKIIKIQKEIKEKQDEINKKLKNKNV